MKIVKNRFVKSKYPYFIADIAANHDGDLSRAKELIWLAKESGADCAKFQHFLADKIVNDREFNKLNILTHQSDWKESVSRIYEKYHFKRSWTHEISEECKKARIDFSTTPYDIDAIEETKELVSFFKIGSGDISWIEHIKACADTSLPIAIATGASSMQDVERAMKLLIKKGNQVCLMQCNTNYTIDKDKHKFVNLNVLKIYKEKYPNSILGLSDHTVNEISVLGAIALGAQIFEKHFTDDNEREGPDHKFAVNPVNWKKMINNARELIDCMGDGDKKVEENEENAFVVQRRSCTAARNIPKEKIIEKQDIVMLRLCPAGAVHPFEENNIIGLKALKEIKKGDSILWESIEKIL
tara:strand:+ start:5281 stop:6345 length:1065 start_codon:yes stop_codon:yes gene_type:complete